MLVDNGTNWCHFYFLCGFGTKVNKSALIISQYTVELLTSHMFHWSSTYNYNRMQVDIGGHLKSITSGCATAEEVLLGRLRLRECWQASSEDKASHLLSLSPETHVINSLGLVASYYLPRHSSSKQCCNDSSSIYTRVLGSFLWVLFCWHAYQLIDGSPPDMYVFKLLAQTIPSLHSIHAKWDFVYTAIVYSPCCSDNSFINPFHTIYNLSLFQSITITSSFMTSSPSTIYSFTHSNSNQFRFSYRRWAENNSFAFLATCCKT